MSPSTISHFVCTSPFPFLPLLSFFFLFFRKKKRKEKKRGRKRTSLLKNKRLYQATTSGFT